MILYHGSNIEITHVDLARSKPYKDFGKGFYLSPDQHQAMRMAEQRVSIELTGKPIVNRFSFDASILHDNTFKVLLFNNYTTEWAKFVMRNRDMEVPQPCHDYDIVYGPIADDGVTFQLRRCKTGVITIEQLVEELKYSKGITFQYFFGTERAISELTKI